MLLQLDVYRNETPGLKPLDDGREDARKKLKVAKEVLMSKFKVSQCAYSIPSVG